jgi:WD40 repeat protein
VVSGAEDSQVRLWNSNEQRCSVIFVGHKGTVTTLSTRSNQVLSGSLDKTLRLWEVEGDGGKALRKFSGHEGGISAACFVDSSLVISGAADATIRLWDTRLKKEASLFSGHQGGVTCLEMGALDSNTIVSGSFDNTIMVWDIRDANSGPVYTLKGHEDRINSLLISGSILYSEGTMLNFGSGIWWLEFHFIHM